MYYVYELVDPLSQTVIYVGKGKKNRAYRFLTMADEKLACSRLQTDLCQHILRLRNASANVVVKIVYQSDCEFDVLAMEVERIAHYGRRTEGGTLFNKTAGGNGLSRYKFSVAHKAAIGNAHRGKVVSVETREHLRLMRLGKKATAETRRKMSESRKGRFTGQDNSGYGREKSLTERLAISNRTSGASNPMFGKKHSEETKRKISDSRRKIVRTNAI